MDTTYIFLRILFQNIEFILPVALVIISISLVGVVILCSLTKETEWYLILPAGAISGLFGFILMLGLLSYVFKGPVGIFIIYILYLLLGFYLYKKVVKYSRLKITLSLKNLPVKLATVVFLGFTAFLVGTNQYGGDVIAYWGFATSFANGNYPIHSPWQPDFLSIHHKGTFMFEGAVHALTNVNLSLIHTMYSYFVIVCGFLLLWGLVRKITKKDLTSIIPSLVAYFSYGALFIPLPALFRSWFNPEVEHVTGRLPLLLDAKNRLGGASNLPEFIYINHRAAAFSGVLLLLLFIFSSFKNERLKPLIIAALSVGIISSDEIYLPIISFIVLIWFIYSLLVEKTKNRINILKKFLLGGLVFILLFFTVENAVRNSLITPSPEPRFKMLTSLEAMGTRSKSLKSAILRQAENSGYFWYLPDLRFIMVVTFLMIFLAKSTELKISSAGIIGAIFAFYTIDHTYYPQNNERFLHVLYQFCGFMLAFALILLVKEKGKLLKYISYTILFLVILPSIIFTFIYLFPQAKKDNYPNYYGQLPTSQVLKWMKKNTPHNRVFFIDGFITEGLNHSPYTLQAIQNFGLMVPISPAKIRVHTPDFGVEAFDVIYTLNPDPLKDLKIDYIFISNNQLNYLPQVRKLDIGNNHFFEKVYENQEGIIFKILLSYLESGNSIGGALSDLKKYMNSGASVYLDYPYRIDGSLRAAILLLLKDYSNIYSEWRSGTFNYIETRLVFNTPTINDKYSYLILGPKTNPLEVCNCKSVNILWQTYGFVLYKVNN